MSRSFDPGLRRAAQAAAEAARAAPAPRDALALRRLIDGTSSGRPRRPAARRADVATRDVTIEGPAGHDLTLRLHLPRDVEPRAVIVYLHGGGLIAGTCLSGDEKEQRYAAEASVALVAVEYRLAPEHSYPAALDDAHAALLWADRHRRQLRVGPQAPLAVLGSSAGAGLAACLALRLRDEGGPALARQLLLHPMLDDRTSAVPADLAPFTTSPPGTLAIAWDAYLPGRAGGADVPAYAAAARAADLAGLPPAYLDVGDLDPFRDETLAYAARLARGGVHVELHVHPGLPHAGEGLAPDAPISTRIVAGRIQALRDLAPEVSRSAS